MPTHRHTDIEIRVLGSLEAEGRAATFAPGDARPGAVLALLAIHAGAAVSADRLLDELWPAQPGSAGIKRVQVNVLRLRRALAAVAPAVDPAG